MGASLHNVSVRFRLLGLSRRFTLWQWINIFYGVKPYLKKHPIQPCASYLRCLLRRGQPWLNKNMKEQFMRAAIRLSLSKMRANCGGPFGAVVVRKGKIVGRGWNQVTSTNDPTAHAEVTAIRDACKKLKTFQLDDCEL